MTEVTIGHCGVCGAPVFANDYLSVSCRPTCHHGIMQMILTKETIIATAAGKEEG